MDGELLSLKWNNHRTTFYHIISGLRNKESYTDVTLACDGKFYPTHKFVLSTCSEYFSEIFDRTPCKNPVIVLKDIQCRDLEFLLDYMYIGEVNVRQNELTSLIKAAECLRVKGLAVPDEEPKSASSSSVSNSVPHSSSQRHRPEQSSPPAKRRRGDERRATSVVADQSPGRPPGDRSIGSPDHRDTQSSNVDGSACDEGQGDISDPIVIKEEKEETQDDLINVQNSYDGEDDGDGHHDSEGNTSEFPEFLQSTIEKEEPVAVSEFNPDFPGPSGLSGLNTWEGDNSTTGFPEGLSGAVAAAVAAASQPQQRQQQQLASGSSSSVVSDNGASQTSLLTCPVCQSQVTDRQILNEHIRHHADGWPHVCSQCDYKTKRGYDLKRHLHLRHKEELQTPYCCPECSYRTSYAVHLQRHIEAKHPDFGLDMSDDGSLSQPSMDNSGLVMPDDLQEEPSCTGVYKCSFCTFETAADTEFTSHMQIHMHKGVWPFSCAHCNYKTRRSHDLKRHIFCRHYGRILRPYRCEQCPYRTTHSELLASHVVKNHPS